MTIGGFGFQGLSGSAAGSASGGINRGITDATGGATAAQAALASAEDKVFADVLRKAYSDGDKEKLKEVCVQFESIMMSMMYKGMKATVPESSFVEKSNAREIFDDMLDEELMQRAGSRGIGLADMLYRQLSRQMDRTFVRPREPAEAVSTAAQETAGEASSAVHAPLETMSGSAPATEE